MTMGQGRVMLTLLAFVSMAVPAAGDAPGDRAVQRAMKRVYPALVRIYVVMANPSGGRMRKLRGAGSGAIISKDGHVVTNHHVAGNATRMVCNLANREEVDAVLVGTDPLADIAVLKLRLDQRKAPKAPVPVAVWGDSDKVKVGDVVMAMGSPAAVSQSVTRGIVSNTQLILPKSVGMFFRLDGENVGAIVRWIAHDAVIFGGNSGGPLVNAQGEIVGINEIGLGSLGGAIPGNLARSVAEEIIKHGHVRRSWTGLEVQPRLKSGREKKGVLVAGVTKDSPAAKAGLQAGDVITGLDGKAVDCEYREQLPGFNLAVMGISVGNTVQVRYLRDGKSRTCKLTTVARQRALAKPTELKSWGITARDLTRMMALERHRADARGVLVDSLRPGGPCGEAKPALAAGDVIVKVGGQDVGDLVALRRISAKLTKGRDDPTPVLVHFDRKQRKMMTVVKIGKEDEKDKPALARKPWPAAETQVLTRDLAKAMGLEGKMGVRVTEVYSGRAADKAGLKVGDIILKVDGEAIEASQPEDVDVYPTMLRQYRIGSTAVLSILRDGKAQTVKMTLEAPPPSGEHMARYVDDDFELTVRDMSLGDRATKQLGKKVRGVLIEKVPSGGWASLGGLSAGDVLLRVGGKPTGDVRAVAAILAEAKKSRPRRLVFFVRRGIHTVFREIEPVWPKDEKTN